MRPNEPEPPSSPSSRTRSPDISSGFRNSRLNNPLKIVVSPSQENPKLRGYLIDLTERLAKEAKNGVLKGLGGFADYGESYIVGLEGSYLEYPEAAVLPIKILEKRVMDDIEQAD